MAIEAVQCSHPGCVDIRKAGDSEVIHCSAAEWAEFIADIKSGKYDQVPEPGT